MDLKEFKLCVTVDTLLTTVRILILVRSKKCDLETSTLFSSPLFILTFLLMNKMGITFNGLIAWYNIFIGSSPQLPGGWFSGMLNFTKIK